MKSYKQAKVTPPGGAVALDYDGVQAVGSEILADRFGLQPRAVYDWVQKHGVNLGREGHLLAKQRGFMLDVINGTDHCLKEAG